MDVFKIAVDVIASLRNESDEVSAGQKREVDLFFSESITTYYKSKKIKTCRLVV